MKRLFCILLAALMMSGTFAMTSCSDNSTSNTDTQVDASTTPEETITDAEPVDVELVIEGNADLTSAEMRQQIPDNLPETDFGGSNFTMATESSKEFEVCSEELTGEVTNDAVYNRNSRIEDRFNVKIVSNVINSTYSDLKTTVMSGTYAYDVAGMYDYLAYTPIMAKVLYNWYDVPHVDTTQPWHNSLANNDATFNGKLFAEYSDLSITMLQYTYGIFFNYEIMKDYNYTSDDLYNLVFEGKWTIDKMTEIVDGIWEDTNGDGMHDADDINGYAVTGTGVNTHDVWLAALDIPVLSVVDGEFSVGFFGEKTVSAVEKILKLYYDSNGSFLDKKSNNWRAIPDYFAAGRVAMTQLYFGETTESLSEMADTYGILPLPKFDENQEHYYTNAWDQFTVFGIPLTMQDPEITGTIYEALCAESYKYVYPAYYDQALKSRYSTEPATAEVVDMIMAGRKLDFTFQFGEKLQRLPYILRDFLLDNDTNVASKAKKIEKALNKTLAKFSDYYE